MNVSLVQGQVYDAVLGDWLSMDNSHIMIILQHNDQQYLIDNGFGIRLPLRAVPLNGDIVVSRNGEFSITKEDGYCILNQNSYTKALTGRYAIVSGWRLLLMNQ